ncbi:hypothetical protein [Streptomyces sp. NPDC059781]|uniref:hypothetical protein n=1 Tax=Streptomyces sp. NPDC059781 TaxID=3346943 RepID=UPI003659F894
MNDEEPPWTGVLTERLRCCVCGESTDDAPDYVLVELTGPAGGARQWFGAHAGHLNGVLGDGFRVEVHLM